MSKSGINTWVAYSALFISIVSAAFAGWSAWTAHSSLQEQKRERAPLLVGKDVAFQQVKFGAATYNLLGAIWLNAGQSPTFELKKARGCGMTVHDAKINMQSASGTAPIAPNATQLSGECILSDNQLVALWRSHVPYIIAAQVQYKDEFGRLHVGNLCYGVIFYLRENIHGSQAKLAMQNLACDSLQCTPTVCRPQLGARLDDLAQSAAP